MAVGLVVYTPVANAGQAPSELSSEAAASAAARKFTKPVRVSSKTTETSEVTANPDGTFTFTTGARPQRARRGNDWVPLDTKLRKNSDGSITPAASTVDVRLAGGSGKPFAVAGREGIEVGLSWPGPLPEPTLDNDTATYPEVLPGVDLRVKITDYGFAQLLVVKTAQAAQQQALRKVTYGSHVKGGTLTEKDGWLELKDPTGRLTFAGNASRMWDSAAHQAKMGVELTGGQISVLPDQKFLADSSTVFPVFIDPEYSWSPGRIHHAVVQSGYHDAKNYDVSWGDLSDLKAGLAPDGSGISRSFVELNTETLVGKWVHKATLRNRVINSHNCSGAGTTNVHFVTNITRQTDWDHQPTDAAYLGSIGRTNNPDFCPSDGGHDMDLTGWARTAAADKWGNMTFGYFGSTESSTSAWRRFDLNPYLEIKYNSYPAMPVSPNMQNGQIPCVRGEANRPYIGTRTPRLRAGLVDPDGGVLAAAFAVYKGPAGNGTEISYNNVVDIPSGSQAEFAVPPDVIKEDGIYSWAVVAHDGELVGPWHEGCDFVVDTTIPGIPKASSTEYPAGQPGGGVGITGTFVLDAKGPTTPDKPTDDVVKFKYSFTDEGGDIPEKVIAADALGGTAAIRYTPRLKGSLTLFVRSEDRAGNLSPIVRHEFFVLPGGSPVAHWKFDGSLTDTNGGNAFTPNGNPNVTLDGYADKAIGLNGSTDYLSRPAVFDSAKSLSVSAWAKLDNADASRVVTAGAGTNVSAFTLHYSGELRKWIFGVSTEDRDTPLRYVASQAAPQIGVWTHLVGTYDAAAGKVVLYVDGVKQGETTAEKSWNAGRLLVGRQRAGGADRDSFAGGIDELRVYDRTLNDAEVKALANQSAQRAYFPLNEGTGKTTKDTVTGRSGTLTGTTEWVREDEYTSVKLGGTAAYTEAYVTSPAPAIRTDRSFTVSAFVNLPARDDANRAVLSLLPANGSSPFYVQYRGKDAKNWSFEMPNSGGGVVSTKTPAAIDDWVQLTAVYDAPNTEMRLYVNGQPIGRATGVTGTSPVPATFEMGRLMWQNTIGDYWKGGLDDVRVFAGALTDEEISRYGVRNP